MSRGINFRNNLNCVILSNCDDIDYILLGVNLAITVLPPLSQFGVGVEDHRERLVIHHMPVKNVEFGQRH